ncbi:GNAT family N-acetyltransferase [Salinithrix halophila]|uniref:GNAT family N-acetyltransferase n=1 Tax=Salinithrix halophila TaxID=1485204 RepID=A0ABV8JAA2_9BACL
MEIRTLTPKQLHRIRPKLVRFSRNYGDRRITHRAIRWLRDLHSDPFPEGTLLAAATEGKRLTGFILFGKFGLEEAYIVVHPKFRNQRVGETLLEHAIGKLGKVYTRVACDNIPSLKLCFSMGLQAFHLTTGPTGKPTLCLGGGNWEASEFFTHIQ